jgi:hypothetical protein
MGIIKGALEYQKFKSGKPLTRKQALLAQCYECNGYEAEDCLGVSCPLYRWSPYRKVSSLITLGLEKPISQRKGKPFPKSKKHNKQKRGELEPSQPEIQAAP